MLAPENISSLIEEQLQKLDPHSSDEERAKIKEILINVLNNGKSIAEAMSFPKEQIEFTYNCAVTLYQEGKYDDAGKLFFYLLRLSPKEARFSFGYAASLHKLHQYEKAASYYFAAGTLDKSDPAPWVHCADCYVNLGNSDAARVFLSKAIEIAGDDPRHEAWREAATALRELIAQHSVAVEDGGSPTAGSQKEEASG